MTPGTADATYWTDRIAQYGHTGWHDPVIYAYDQPLRLRAVSSVIATLGLEQARCLDFGCGVGDFAAALARRGYRVWAYDVADTILRRAALLNSDRRIVYTSRLEDALTEPLDLVLCVTALQAVVDDAQFHEIVGRLTGALSPLGRVVVLETFAPVDTSLGYVRFRTRGAFLRQLEAAGLELETAHSFHHPLDNPTPRYLRYRRSPLVRLLVRLRERLPAADRLIRVVARYHAGRDPDYLLPGSSPTEVMVFRRRTLRAGRSPAGATITAA